MASIKPRYDNLHQLPQSVRRTIWRGCHGDGLCRPCGHVHNFSYSVTGKNGLEREDRFLCSINYHQGCPRPMPEVAHTFVNGKCEKCGIKAQYIAPDGTKHRTKAAARRHGWTPSKLRLEGEESKG